MRPRLPPELTREPYRLDCTCDFEPDPNCYYHVIILGIERPQKRLV